MRLPPSLRASLLLVSCLLALLSYWGWLLYRLLGPQLTQELPDLGSLTGYLTGLFVLLLGIWLLAYLSYRFTFRQWMLHREKRLYYWSWLCFLAWMLFELLQLRTDQEPAFVDENILVTLLLLGVVILYGFIADSLQSRRMQQRLVQQKTEAELTALKAQVNPHFLFNALNTIYNEAQQLENQSVADLIEQLASIMRFTLQESTRSLISVEQEFQFLEKYLALQRARLPKLDNLHVNTQLDWDGQSAQLPPLLLIPFIENMFQYGVSTEHPATLELDIKVENGQLDLPGFQHTWGHHRAQERVWNRHQKCTSTVSPFVPGSAHASCRTGRTVLYGYFADRFIKIMLRAIAIDDEPAALEVLNRYADKVPFVDLVSTFINTTDALTYLHAHRVDLIFLDIRMPDLMGTDFAQLVAPLKKSIIFTTAYADYALEGFTLNALDYLLKPIDFARFLHSCNRAYTQYLLQQGEPSGIFVKDGYDWVRVNLNEVLYIHSDTNLLFIHEPGRQVNTRMTLAEMIDILPNEQFIRIHKSYIVALKAIRKIERHQITVGDVVIPLASGYRQLLEQRLLRR